MATSVTCASIDVAQLAPENLADVGFRQRVDETHDARHLVAGHAGTAMRDHLGLRHAGARQADDEQLDGLAGFRMRHADARRLGHAPGQLATTASTSFG